MSWLVDINISMSMYSFKYYTSIKVGFVSAKSIFNHILPGSDSAPLKRAET